MTFGYQMEHPSGKTVAVKPPVTRMTPWLSRIFGRKPRHYIYYEVIGDNSLDWVEYFD